MGSMNKYYHFKNKIVELYFVETSLSILIGQPIFIQVENTIFGNVVEIIEEVTSAYRVGEVVAFKFGTYTEVTDSDIINRLDKLVIFK